MICSKILNIIIIISIIFIVLNVLIGGIFEYHDRNIKFEETTKETDVKFCNLDAIKIFGRKIYCLNDNQRMIIILSEDGKLEKSILLPGKSDAGVNDIYILRNKFCIITVNNELYQYTSFDNYIRIIYSKNKMKVYDKSNNLIKQMQAYDDQILYYGKNGKEIITYDFTDNLFKEYYEGEKKKERKINYDDITKRNNFIRDGKTEYRIGKLKNAVYKKENGENTIVYKAKFKDTLLYSDVIAKISVISFILCALLKKIL